MHRVAVVGARRERQGIGEYVCKNLVRSGCDVSAIVGTTTATLETAREHLRDRHGIESVGYLSLDTALENESVDVVAICSPATTHLPLLETAADAGCHVLCDKPLWWSANLTKDPNGVTAARDTATAIVDRFEQAGKYLELNTQWPFTLAAFCELYPNAYGPERPVARFAMHLSPISQGTDMVVDAAPHLISMLQTLVGPGSFSDIHVTFRDLPDLGERSALSLESVYTHANGDTEVAFELARCLEVPRPAGYSINDASVERHVSLPGYVLSFTHGDKRVPLRDPLEQSVEHFVQALDSGQTPDRNRLVDGMAQLVELVRAAQLGELK